MAEKEVVSDLPRMFLVCLGQTRLVGAINREVYPMGRKRKAAKTAEENEAQRNYESQAYWEERYVSKLDKTKPKVAKKKSSADDTEDITDEWYFSYDALQPLFEHHIRNVQQLKLPSKTVLDIGCGVSQLFADMRNDGWEGQLVGIDYSPTLVKHLQHMFPTGNKQGFQFVEMDAKNLKFADESVHVVIDKATTDGMMSSSEGADTTPLMYAEVSRVLAPGGVYIVATVNEPSWLSEFVVESLLKGSESSRWRIGVHSFSENEKDAKVYVFEKLLFAKLRASTLRQATERVSVVSFEH